MRISCSQTVLHAVNDLELIAEETLLCGTKVEELTVEEVKYFEVRKFCLKTQFVFSCLTVKNT